MTSLGYAYTKRWHHERRQGVLRLVDAAPVRAHLAQLLADGWSQRAIAEGAGVGATTVNQIIGGVVQKVKRPTAEALLAVTATAILDRSNPLGFVRRVGAQRRVQALLAIGHRHEDITAAMRLHGGKVTLSHLILSQSGEWVTRATHDAVRAAYDNLSMRPGLSTRTRLRAQAAGFLPPLAWDDDTIDDPTAKPEKADGPIITQFEYTDGPPFNTDESSATIDEIAVERAIRGDQVRLTKAEKSVAVATMTRWGMSAAEIAERLNVSSRTVVRRRTKAAA